MYRRETLVALAAATFLFLAGGATTAQADIVFSNGGRVVSMEADGSHRQVLSPDREIGYSRLDIDPSPSVSADGSRLAYIEEFEPEDGGTELRLIVANKDGSDRTELMRTNGGSGPVLLQSPDWSSDGRLYVVVSLKPSGRGSRYRSQVVSMAPDGTDRKVEFKRHLTIRSKSVRGTGDLSQIDISPDGKQALATSLSAVLTDQIELVNLSTGKSRVIQQHGSGGAWSPDGTQVLFASSRKRMNGQCVVKGCRKNTKVYVMDLNSSGTHRLTKGRAPGNEADPSWSPDGSRIAFSSDRNSLRQSKDDLEIYTVEPDGKCLTWLTNGSPASSNPSWAPELDAGLAPSACGSKSRDPLVELIPELHPEVYGHLLKWPRLWLGPVFDGNAQDIPDNGEEIGYEDCTRFDRQDCSKFTVDLAANSLCLNWAEQLVIYGQIGKVGMRRGAFVFQSKRSDRVGEWIVLTGGQAVSITSFDRAGAHPVAPKRYFDVIDALRPVGTVTAFGPLQPPVVDSRLPRQSAWVARVVHKAGTIKVAKSRLEMKPAEIRGWLRVDRALKRFGPFKTKKCRGDLGL